MEFGLKAMKGKGFIYSGIVSILVVMEFGLKVKSLENDGIKIKVSILVVMEFGLKVFSYYFFVLVFFCFNPCCNGIRS